MENVEEEEFTFYTIPEAFQRDKSSEAEEIVIKMSKARTLLHFDLPFFGFLLSQMEIFPVKDEPKVKSFAMDTRRIYVNTEFFREMRTSKLREYLLHAIIHLIMKHGERGAGKNKKTWGMSCDVNSHSIIKETLYTSIESSSNREKYDFQDLSNVPENLKNISAEEIDDMIYNYANNFLSREDQKIKPSKKEFPDEVIEEVVKYTGLGIPCNYIENYDELTGNLSNAMQKAEKDRFMGMIKYAYDQAKRQGKVPGNLTEYIDDIINPRIPWYTYLEQFIQKSIVSDYKWVPPNRRFIHRKIYLPSTNKENIDIVIALDTSGSISNLELQSFLSEAMAIFNSFGNITMTVIQCDYAIQNVVRVEAGENVDGGQLPWESQEIYGRGGTSFIPVFNYIQEKEIDTSILVYFTDGYGDFPSIEPEYDVYWIMTTNVDPPFGNTIRYDINDLA